MELAVRIERYCGMDAMPHVTCINKTRQEIENRLVGISYAELHNILALRGDKPEKRRRVSEYHKHAYQMLSR